MWWRIGAAVGLVVAAGALARTTTPISHAAHFTPASLELAEKCPGSHRWNVKTLADNEAKHVHFDHVELTTINKLRVWGT
jgi:hypothetical protein